MSNDYIISYALVNIFWIYIIKRYMNLFFKELSVSKNAVWFAYISFYLINTGVNLLYHYPALNVLTSLLGLFIITKSYLSSLRKKLVAIFIVYSISMATDISVAVGLGQYVAGDRLSVIYNVVSYLLIFIILVLLNHFQFLNVSKEYTISKYQFLGLIGVPLFSIIIVCEMVLNRIRPDRVIIITSIVLLGINILVFSLYDSVMREHEEKYKNIILENQVAMYSNQLTIINQTNSRVEGIYHDIKHHMYALMNLVNNEAKEEALKYISKVVEISVNNVNVSTGNSQIDGILNYLFEKAVDKGIKVNHKLNIAKGIGVDFFDLNIVLANLIDNAITANEQVINKYIDIVMEMDRNTLYIEVKNPFNGKIKKEGGELKTLKNNTRKHGYGMRNIKSAIDKYNGLMDIEYNDSVFKVSILLYLNDKC